MGVHFIVKNNSMSASVTFTGEVSNVKDYLRASDIFVLPTENELFSNSLIEAMACGLPVVSSSVGGLPELVRHNETGYIAEFGNVERMALYTIDLLKNEKKYKAFSKNARARAVNNFELDSIIPKYEKYYESIMEK